jgi:hypothetical protein
MYENDKSQRIVVSYLTLRRTIGVLGVALPVLLVMVHWILMGVGTGIEDSISDYYGTVVRDILVGVLFTIGWFLFAYRGEEPEDDVAGDLACLFALGVALFPTTSDYGLIRILHGGSAALLFLTLSYFCLRLFTKTEEHRDPTKEKITRNRIYRTCGVIILVCIALIAIYYLFLSHTRIAAIKPVFWLELFALWAFGFSWFIKGETLFKDANTEG